MTGARINPIPPAQDLATPLGVPAPRQVTATLHVRVQHGFTELQVSERERDGGEGRKGGRKGGEGGRDGGREGGREGGRKELMFSNH